MDTSRQNHPSNAGLADGNSQRTTRPSRDKRPSWKADEAARNGQPIPGQISSPRSSLASPSAALTPKRDRHGQASPSTMAQKRKKTETMRPRSTAAAASAQPSGEAADNEFASMFGHTALTIYSWPYPQPKNLEKLHPSRVEWKRKTDEAEKLADIDDGSEDWYEFSGNPENYESDNDMFYCIANVFVHRAKRAFWAGKEIHEFEAEERAINPMTVVMQEQDEEKRLILAMEQLGNGIRLKVFDALKYRLSLEIWQKKYLPLSEARHCSIPVRPKNDSKANSATTSPAVKAEDVPSPTPEPSQPHDDGVTKGRQVGESGRRVADRWN